jgi:hypothetical protein
MADPRAEDFNFSLDEAAVFQHEMFMSWIRAGFTREEALQLLIASMRSTSNGREE